jgi:hypothetical protein
MKIKKTSWHYRVHKFLHNVWSHPIILVETIDPTDTADWKTYYPKSLCTYFWSTLAMIIFSPLLVAILVIMVVVAVILLAVFVQCWFFDYCVWQPRKKKKALKELKSGNSPKVKEPSMIGEFVRAKKGKYCPRIELV